MDYNTIVKLTLTTSWDELKSTAYELIDNAKAKHKRIPYAEIKQTIVRHLKNLSDENFVKDILNIK